MASKIITIESLKLDLINLGIRPGDILFITIDIFNVGFFHQSKKITLDAWINLFLNIVGNDGAIVFAAYSNVYFRFKKKNIFFERYSKTYCGSLPNAVINKETSIRSGHPTNSVVGIGEIIRPILNKHTAGSKPYSIMGDLLSMPNCKFLMIGTIDKFNAPQSMHFVQEQLGYTKLNMFRGMYQINYFVGNTKHVYTRKEFGGCSSGGYKLFSNLVLNDAVFFSNVGNAKSAIMNASKSYEIIYDVLSRDRKYIKCDNKNCINCYGDPFNNGFGIIPFYISRFLSKLKEFI